MADFNRDGAGIAVSSGDGRVVPHRRAVGCCLHPALEDDHYPAGRSFDYYRSRKGRGLQKAGTVVDDKERGFHFLKMRLVLASFPFPI